MNIQDLKTKGFVGVSYPEDLREAVKLATKSWQAFCALPKEVKLGLPYSNSADGVGYEFKDGTGVSADRKENFDLTLASKSWLENNAKNIKNPIALEFIENCLPLINLAETLILDFAKDVEKTFNIEGFVDEVLESRENFFFRFIHYFPGSLAGQETAQAHVDQSGFTLHLFESAKGLECLNFDRQWVPMPVSESETVIIPSMQLQLRSDCQLKALTHRVVANQDTEQNGRFSAVCFIQLKNTPKYDKGRWGRLQEMVPGFNYSISLSDFSRFFM